MRTITITADNDGTAQGDGLDVLARVTAADPGEDGGLPLEYANYRKVSPGLYVHVDDLVSFVQHMIDGHAEGDEEIWALEAVRDRIKKEAMA